jgi:hypothetical protein
MGLEERTIETIGDRCEVCDVPLTQDELTVILEAGGPVLCAVHADELVSVEEDDGEPDGAA